MTPRARFQAAALLLGEVLETDRPADGVVNAYFRAHKYMGSTDRRAVGAMVWGTIRARSRLSWHLEGLGAQVTPRLLLIAWMVLVDGRDAVEVTYSFPDGKPGPYDPKGLTANDHRLLEALAAGKTLNDPALPDSVRFELPDWLFDRLRREFGDRTHEELDALLPEAPLDVRVNTLKCDRETAADALRAERMETTPGLLSPWALRLEGRPNLAATQLFRDGWVEVQDEGSQLVALAAHVRPGMTVLDLCAGAGGKTLALAAAMENKGTLVATDINEKRLARARDRLLRAGVHNVTCRTLDGETNRWLKRRKGSFDVVLVDAPCSGTGTFRRNPDARWRLWPKHIDRLKGEQTALLNRAATLVKPGGRLVYATCSLLGEENEAQVSAFLGRFQDYTLTSDAGGGPSALRFSPAKDGTDGFFVAVMERNAGSL